MNNSEETAKRALAPSRREFLRGMGGVALAAGLGSLSQGTAAAQETRNVAGAFRVLFLPCIHFRTEPIHRSAEGLRTALQAAMNLDPKPALVLTGGDLCHDLFICSGSVSGAQWRGPDHGTPEGFGVVDCRPDGNFDYRYHPYGWKADPAARGNAL